MTGLVPLPADPSLIEQSSDPGQYVVLACERAKAWLADALEHGDIDQIIELKSQAEAIRVYTAQKQLGKDAELSASEIVRRAERGIGLAIRRGQEEGAIATKRDNGAQGEYMRHGRRIQGRPLPQVKKTSPQEFFAGGKEQNEIYSITDDVSDDDFEEALSEAKSEGNLSRANVVRKVNGGTTAKQEQIANRRVDVRRLYEQGNSATEVARAIGISVSTVSDDIAAMGIARFDRTRQGLQERDVRIREMAAEAYTSRQIAKALGMTDIRVRYRARQLRVEIPADRHVVKTHRHDSMRIVEQLVLTAEHLTAGADLIEYEELDPSRLDDWVSSLDHAIKSLQTFKRRLSKELTHD